MTQREEIINNIGYKITKAAMEYYQTNCANDVDLSEAFEEGAEWMQETMIDKACKWLINIDFDDFHFRDCDELFNNDLFVDAFRKAMEE